MLSPEDQVSFSQLKQELSGPRYRFNRNEKVAILRQQMEIIQQFCIRGDEDDWKRCYQCGIIWLDGDAIAINIKQIGQLIGKSKSSINSNVGDLSFSPVRYSHREMTQLRRMMPILDFGVSEMRRWTIRRRDNPHEPNPQPNAQQPAPPGRAELWDTDFDLDLDFGSE
jgi:hypothetical protein